MLTKIGKVYSKLEQDFERTPTNDEIASIMEIDSDEIASTLKKSSYVASIDSPIAASGNSRLLDVIENPDEIRPDTELMDESLRNDVNYLLDGLSKRESKILKLYFGLDGKKPRTLEEVGMEFKLTRERIRQIKENALKKLRQNSRNKVLRQYLG